MKILLLIIMCVSLHAKHLHTERYYQDIFCDSIGGETEAELEDFTRIDCLTHEYAIEVDFADKWAESIGQSLHYGILSDRLPAVYLILENKKDERFLRRLKNVAEMYHIKVFTNE